MADELSFRLEINPWDGAINRKDRATRRGRKPGRYNTSGYTHFVAAVAAAANAAAVRSGVRFAAGPVVLDVIMRGARRSTKYGACGCAADADGPLKAVMDALTGAVWSDDVQVVEIRARKRYAAKPSLEVVVTAADPTDTERKR
jgi:Holliday junction resolvase RusA-like endonuclease